MADPTTSVILDGWEMQVLTTLIDGPCSGIPGHDARVKMEMLREKLIAARGRLVESGAYQPANKPPDPPPAPDVPAGSATESAINGRSKKARRAKP